MLLRCFHKTHKAGSQSLTNLPPGKLSGNSNTRDSYNTELVKGKDAVGFPWNNQGVMAAVQINRPQNHQCSFCGCLL